MVVTDREAAGRALQRINFAAEPSEPAVEDPRRLARARSISTVVASTISVIIWVMALFVILGELGIDLAPLIAGAGIAGVALGFGAQSLVKDCLSGLFMLIEDQFGIGDVVDVGEAAGVVERVSLRATVLRSLDGTVWHVPNGEIVRVGNRSQLWSVAVIDVVVGYEADVERAGRILEETAKRGRRAAGPRRPRARGARPPRRRIGSVGWGAPAPDRQDHPWRPVRAAAGPAPGRQARLRRGRDPAPAAATPVDTSAAPLDAMMDLVSGGRGEQ